MSELLNNMGQPIGKTVSQWSTRHIPAATNMLGRTCRLEPINAVNHAKNLYQAFVLNSDNTNWTYLTIGPFAEFDSFSEWVDSISKWEDPLFYAIIDLKSGKAVGAASYLRLNPVVGVIEVGNIHFSPLLQRTTLATESMFLMMTRVFDELGYRRYEWKCDALNHPSREAALRLGYTFEGIFRQATIYKGRSRDTAWFSIIDKEWGAIKTAYESWLAPENFDQEGEQIRSLRTFMPKS